MRQPYRLAEGGLLIDRARPLSFTFNGRRYQGYQGDTLASALLANGVHLVGRSFKYHRPRGIFSAGVEEPNALVELGVEGRHQPNTRATEVPLLDGLEARSQNCWPSVGLDLGALAQGFGPLLPAGFYYKTFMGPGRAWMRYERYIRRAAGLGRAPREPLAARHDKRHAFCDVLIVGAGPAGLMAALAAARSGARVILADERPVPGGGLLDEPARLDGLTPLAWVERAIAELEAFPDVQVLRRAAVLGRYRHGLFTIAQQPVSGHGGQMLHHVRARQAVMATGAIERPLIFADNDRPGVMLAGAVRRYLDCYGVAPGRRAVVLTNNDSAYDTARALLRAGVELAAILDVRGTPPGLDTTETIAGARVIGTRGRRRVSAVDVATGNGRRRIPCDLLCVSGGWTPTLHLYAHGGNGPVFDAGWGAFVPGAEAAKLHCAGTCNGTHGLERIFAEGWQAGRQAAWAAGFDVALDHEPPPLQRDVPEASPHCAPVIEAGQVGKCFVDLQNDVTVADLELAVREGYRAIEHVKRYTTLGMGTDQGRTSNINGMRIVAERLGQSVHAVGTTTFRPPYTPVTLGALAGRESGPRIAALRRSPMHDWHERAGAVFMPSALWWRPQYYRHHGEDLAQAARAEAVNVRRKVGIADVSTLGKIEIEGTDAAELLHRVYVNRWKKLAVGKARYGMMLREDGCVFDDGTSSRLAENRFLMTTTSANAGAVLSHLEFHRQMIWPELDVRMTSVTDQWAVVALAGPASRDVLARLFAPQEVDDETLPFMGVLEMELHGIPVRVFRLSFSGERACEIAVPADHGLALWEALMEIGEPFGIMPYGLEAMDYLRIEKGHVIVGAEIDGRVAPRDLGMERMVRPDGGFIGARSLARPAFHEPDRLALAGFVSADRRTPIPAGAQLVAAPYDGSPQQSLGRITSPGFSPVLDCPIALGLIAGGAGQYHTVYAVSPLTGEQTRVKVTDPVFHDPAGEKLRD